MENANWVYEQAAMARVFNGPSNNAPTKEQIQALTDVLNALGWNSGLRKPSKSLAADAWWNLSPAAAPSLFNRLSDRYQTNIEIKALFQLARDNSATSSLPCKAHPDNLQHRYQVNNGAPFRIRCCRRGCYNKLQGAAVIKWIAELVSLDVIDGSALGLTLDGA